MRTRQRIFAFVLASAAMAVLTACTPAATEDTAPPTGDGGSTAADTAGQSITASGDYQLFPDDNWWNTPIDDLPVHPQSDAWVSNIGRDKPLHPDFGSGLWEGRAMGFFWVEVNSSVTPVDVSFYYPEESDPGPYPIPADVPIEGDPDESGDRHILIVDRDAHMLYEIYDARQQPNGTWEAGSGAVWDLDSNDLRPDGWTSADAAGLPILPGLVRYDEVASGEITHAIRFTIEQTADWYMWPARHYASDLHGSQYPPMGARFRLKADVDISGFPPDVQVILQALKTYGMVVADNCPPGGDWFISGENNDSWNNETLHEMQLHITGDDFEAVDTSVMMIDPDSGQARQ